MYTMYRFCRLTTRLCFRKTSTISPVIRWVSSKTLERAKRNIFTGRSSDNYSRCLHTGSSNWCRVQNDSNNIVTSDFHGIALKYGDYHLDLPYMWLRDHCRCKLCYNQETFQRANGTLFPPQNPKSVEFQSPVLSITWDDNHITSYNIDWLLQNTHHDCHTERIERFLWNKESLQSNELPLVEYDDYMNSDDALKEHLTNLLKFGFSIVTGVEPSHEGSLKVSERVCFIMETLYGHSWQFTSDLEFKDTAYTQRALGAHTDNTYFTAPSGIQVFHVINHEGEGGRTLLVDGFQCAETLRTSSPESFETLTELVVPHEYIDNNNHMRSLGTVLDLHPTTNELNMIRYNPYDRAPLYTLKGKDVVHFYESYAKLGKHITDPVNEFWIKLRPDMVLFVDNWRVLHGREAFTGRRHVSGCYLSRDDWTSKARAIGLMNL